MSRKKQKALRGTRVRAEGDAAALSAVLDGLIARGERHARRRQFGCAFVVLGVLTGVALLFFTRHYYAMGIIGAVAVVAWLYTASLDHELAEDRRLRMVRNLLRTAERWGGAQHAYELDLELNAFDADVPTKKEPLRAGRLRAWYHQRWLRLAADGRALEIHVDAELVQDGIEIVKEDVVERAVRCEDDDETPVEATGWTEGRAEGLADFDALRAAARAVFGD